MTTIESATETLDVRPVEPKHRFETIMGAYRRLAPGERLALTVDHDPECMYYTLLAEHGADAFAFDYLERGPEAWRVVVTRHRACVAMNATPPIRFRSPRLDVAERLRTVIDPEVGINIVDLGLVYDVRVEAGRVEVDLTMTTPACPLSSYITQEVEAALGPLVGAGTVRVELVWNPRWSPHMIASSARM